MTCAACHHSLNDHDCGRCTISGCSCDGTSANADKYRGIVPTLRQQPASQILMQAQVARELLDYPTWRTDTPPRVDHYLVSTRHGDGQNVRLEYWDGNGWPLSGAYTVIDGWMERPAPMRLSAATNHPHPYPPTYALPTR